MLNINFTPFPVLATERLILRSLEPTDDAGIFRLRNNALINQYIDRPKSITLRQAREFIAKINRGVSKNDWVYWAITLRHQPGLIGTICIWNIYREECVAELGYELYPDFQGKGIMQEAFAKVLEYGFHHMKLRSIEAFTHRENERSTNLLLRNNFRVKEDQQLARGNEVIYFLPVMRVF